MSKSETKGNAYIEKILSGTNRYTQDLLRENEKLRVLAASLDSERHRLEEEVAEARNIVVENEGFRALVAFLERDKRALSDSLRVAEEAVERYREEHSKLEAQLADIGEQSRRFSEQYLEVEQQNTNLANLYVASYRLHSTLDRREVLEAIQEIIINLVGSEELAVLEVEPDGTHLRLLASFGVDDEAFARLPAEGIIGNVVRTGQAYVVENAPHAAPEPFEATLTACIPLKLDDRVTGVIAVFRLLQQKQGLEAIDHELFDLLATHAATALYCTALSATHQHEVCA